MTTLGRALAARLGAVHIDTDDHHWLPTDPPYQHKRDVADRRRRIAAEQARTGKWVVSGTLDAWAEGIADEAELIVFLEAPTETRLERLRRREQSRFGDSLLPGGAMYETHRAFIDWAAQYEQGMQPGRSRPRHERWLSGLAAPALRLDATRPPTQLIEEIMRPAPLPPSSQPA